MNAITTTITTAGNGLVGVTEADMERVTALLERIGPTANTTRSYERGQKRFEEWAADRGVTLEEINPAHIAVFVADRAEGGAAPATIRSDVAGVSYGYRSTNRPDPTAVDLVRGVLKAVALGVEQRPADPITERELEAILAALETPRVTGRGGRLETREAARRRAAVDRALLLAGRDMLARRSELVAITWGAIKPQPKGWGSIRFTRIKTKTETTAPLAPATMTALRAIKPKGAPPGDRVFPVARRTVARRVARMAEAAGCSGRYSAHSIRRGMAQDMAADGEPTGEIMNAGGWSDARTVQGYTQHEDVLRGAVARFHLRRAG